MASTSPVNSTFSVVSSHSANLPCAKSKQDAQLMKQFCEYEYEAMMYFQDRQQIVLPECLSGADKEKISSFIAELRRTKKQANLRAQMLGRKCDRLQQRCEQLQEEKESVRYFWKKVLEGHTRGGSILMKCLSSKSQP